MGHCSRQTLPRLLSEVSLLEVHAMSQCLRLLLGASLLALSGCQNSGNPSYFNGQNVGAVAGGVAGVLVGSQATKGSGQNTRALGILGGGAAGALLGGVTGNAVDNASTPRGYYR